MVQTTEAGALLSVRDVGVRFGGIVALDGVSFDVAPGHIVGLIGPNGAGKTTLFNCLSRLYECDRGDIHFGSQSLRQVPRHGIAALGIGRTFQNLALFRTMTVLDNVMIGRHSRTRTGFLRNALRTPEVKEEEVKTERKCRQLIDLLELGAVAHTRVADLPFGTQKRVELARALAAEPSLLLLDEPTTHLDVAHAAWLLASVARLRQLRGLTVVMVLHDLVLASAWAPRVVILHGGRIQADGPPSEALRADIVREAYGIAVESVVTDGGRRLIVPHVPASAPESTSAAGGSGHNGR